MFLLSNNIKIDEEGLVKALNDKDTSHLYYLDSATRQVGCVDGKDNKIINSARYFRAPKVSEKTKRRWIKEFIKEMVAPENRFLANLFSKPLKTKNKSTE